MKKVLIMQGICTNIDVINECHKRNIQPIMFVQKSDTNPEIRHIQEARIKTYPRSVKVIRELDTYEKTLARLKKEGITNICYMSEVSVKLAAKLANDLKIPGLAYKYMPYYIYKDGMQEILKKNGIRHIRGKVVSSIDDALKTYEEYGSKPVVMKPVRGGGTVGVKFCYTRDEVAKAAKEILSEKSMLTDCVNTEFVVQEFIMGEEYVVNTSVVNGKTRIMTIVKYNLVKANDRLIYNNMEFINPDKLAHLGMTDLIDYVFQVNKAMRFDNGFIHAEFYLDEKGPVLIEVNCRTMGGPFSSDLMSNAMRFSDHQTVLNETLFSKDQKKLMNHQYRLFEKTILSFVMNYSSKEIHVKSAPLLSLIKRFKSYHHHIQEFKDVVKPTIDFETLTARVYLQHKCGQIVSDEDRFLRMLNERYFYMLIEAAREPDTSVKKSKGVSAKQYIKDVCEMGTVLYLTDKNEQIPFVKTTNLEKVHKELPDYQFGVINFNKKPKYNRQELVDKMFAFLDKIVVGGQVFIPNQAYQIFPYGTAGYEIILKLAGFKVEIPHDDYRGLFAKKIY